MRFTISPLAWDLKLQKYWLFGTCVLLWMLIMLGGATRLTHSGLSIVEWKPVTGILPPLSLEDWLSEFGKYQQFSEYQSVNQGMTLADFQFIFWMEYAHRLLARGVGLFFFIPYLFFWKRGSLIPFIKKGSLLALGIGALQGAMGWYMVKSGLGKDPFVSPYRLAAHLLLALMIYGLVFYMGLRVRALLRQHSMTADSLSSSRSPSWPQNPPRTDPKSLRLMGGGLMTLLLTLFYGALVAGQKAGWIYNTYPLMGGDFFPTDGRALTPWWLNGLENPATVQWIHRRLAELTFMLLVTSMMYILKRKGQKPLKTAACITIVSVGSQVLLGIATLLYQVPVFLGTLHQGNAVVVLSVCLYTRFLMGQEK